MSVGLGDAHHAPQQVSINVYIANRPPMPPYDELDDCMPMQTGDIGAIAQHTGNHWRKVFNVYAKLMYEFMQTLDARTTKLSETQHFTHALKNHATWQQYRDDQLLQADSGTTLLFSPPLATEDHSLHIIMGKGYALQLGYEYQAPFLIEHEHEDFACYRDQKVILCPYFDYRQLSNQKITTLVGIMLSLLEIT
ncbi:DUF6942 family protein [Pseudomonas sp. HK3]